LNFAWILYFNQLLNSSVKVYCLFRLSKQRWSNRGDQRSDNGVGMVETLRNAMAFYLTTLYVSILALTVISYSGLLDLPGLRIAHALLLG